MATGGPYYQVAFGQLSQTVFMISLSPDGNNYYETKQLLISFPLPLSLSQHCVIFPQRTCIKWCDSKQSLNQRASLCEQTTAGLAASFCLLTQNG